MKTRKRIHKVENMKVPQYRLLKCNDKIFFAKRKISWYKAAADDVQSEKKSIEEKCEAFPNMLMKWNGEIHNINE